MIRFDGKSSDETKFAHKLLLTDTQVSKMCKAFTNGLSANIKYSKIQLSKMTQSEGIIGELIAAIPQVMFLAGKEVLKRGILLAPKVAPISAGKATEYYINKGINKINKKFISSNGSGITLTNNEIKDIIKVIKYLENRGILLEATTRKTTSQGGFSNFLRPLMTAGLPLMKNVLTPLAKNFLLLIGLSAGTSAADAAIQKIINGSGPSDFASHTTALIISNEETEDILKIFKSFEESALLIKIIT